MQEYTVKDALKSLAETGACPMTPPIMGELIEVGYFHATLEEGKTSKEFYREYLESETQAQAEV
jgi:hypothetical protein